MKRCLGLIPARGGSKGIPRKNLAPLLGRPLLAWSCEAALRCRRLTRLLVSTDDAEIAAVARALGADVPFLRPAELARDQTPMIDVARHALAWCEEEGGQELDAVVILQPTSPLRRSSDIDAAIERLESTGADAVVSVVRVPHAFEPGSLLRRDADGRLTPLQAAPPVLRRQDKPELYARNGPAVLAVRRTALLRGGFYDGHVVGLEMPSLASIDIDEPQDLELAALVLEGRQARERFRG